MGLHALTSVLPPALQSVVYQPLQHHHHHHQAHQEHQDHSEPQDPQDQQEAQDQLDHQDHQEPQLDQLDHPEDQDQQDHPDQLDHQDHQDQLDQTAHQDHSEPQPHHHHHHHHHRAQQSVLPRVSQHAQLPAAHRRSTSRLRKAHRWLDGCSRLSDISCSSHATSRCSVTTSVDRLFLHGFINLANAVVLWIGKGRSSF